MKIRTISAQEIDEGIREKWCEIQKTNPSLANPYFSVEYTETVASVRNDIYLGIMEEGSELLGFFPFQLRKNHFAEPVGGRMSDYQGMIVPPNTNLDIFNILRGCNLKRWDFDHLLLDQKPTGSFHYQNDISLTMDISEGFDNYLKMKRSSGSKRLMQFQRKGRKLEREVGPLRFETYSESEVAFQQVIDWKRDQCVRTGAPDFLGWDWTRSMLEQIWTIKSNDLTGMLSVLYAGDEIVAAHFGMRSSTVCHWWFPTYNPKFSKYSPGGLLLLNLAESMADEGLSLIDLGKGKEVYKPSFSTGGIKMSEGSIMRPSPIAILHKTRLDSKRFLRESPYTSVLKTPLRGIRKLIKAS